MNISIIVLTYNAKKYTEKCLDSIRHHTTVPYELIVIDNASTDGTVEMLEERAKENEFTTLVLNRSNQGVAGGRNQGLELARQDIVIFLDNDTVVGKDWDTTILKHFYRDQKIGIVGKHGVFVNYLTPVSFDSVKDTQECDVVAGFCFALRRKLVGEIGDQFKDFPNGKFWHEDLEYCLRAKRAGYKVIQDPKIEITHFGHMSVGEGLTDKDMVEKVDGFDTNGKAVFRRFRGSNIVEIMGQYKEDDISAFGIIANNISRELRKLGYVVLWKQPVNSKNKSFDLCRMPEIHYNGFRIVSFFVENDRPPKSWQKPMELVDYCLSSSMWITEACRNEPYLNKMKNISPCGIDHSVFNTQVEPIQSIEGHDLNGKFLFLHNGASQPRKNTWNMIAWYAETFKNRSDVVLLVKEGPYGYADKTKDQVKMLTKAKGCPQIIHIAKHLSNSELAGLYRRCAINGAYLHPHKAEGFGLPQLEAMACGCRVGTSDFGGPRYNFRYDSMRPVVGATLFSGVLEDSKFHNWPKEPYYDSDEYPRWFAPNAQEVIDWMKKVVKEEWTVKSQERVSKYILKEWNWETRGIAIADFLSSLPK